ncbi:hypothetical protein BdWA1_000521 [Babesia duncani]|uniref:Uncharacterized protein n=1 Tax=Babesia duncani TaxID=323732 RepID=A0AAD9PMB6_9APIC|nr:hypothetical protein BdWA1_000521 [Babesia duncani]
MPLEFNKGERKVPIQDDAVEALLCRKPNSVKQYIQSLNKQLGSTKSPIQQTPSSRGAKLRAPRETFEYEGHGDTFRAAHSPVSAVPLEETSAQTSPYPEDFVSLDLTPSSFFETEPLSYGGGTPIFSSREIPSLDSSDKLCSASPVSVISSIDIPTERCFTDVGFSTVTPVLRMQKCNSDICYSSARFTEFNLNKFHMDDTIEDELDRPVLEQPIEQELQHPTLFEPIPAHAPEPTESIKILNSSWIWIYSKRQERWVSKYAALVYEEKQRPLDLQENPSGFWGIYQIYSKMKNINVDQKPPNAANVAGNRPRKIIGKAGEFDLIPDGACVYFCIFDKVPQHLQDAVVKGEFLEIMQVDTSCVPSVEKLQPNGWLSGLVAKSMSRKLLLMISIPLMNGLECKFLPMAAAEFDGKDFSFRRQCAKFKSVDFEYDSWMLPLWEFALRNGAIDEFQQTSRGISKCLGMLTGLFKYMLEPQTRAPSPGPRVENVNLRNLICSRINPRDASSPPKDISKIKNGLGDKFTSWISTHGFDDLSVKMNLYSLAKRSGE